MDFMGRSDEFIFEGAPHQVCVEITITDDGLMEQRESFLVILNTTLTSQTVLLSPQFVFVTITDDDCELKIVAGVHELPMMAKKPQTT